MDKKYIEVFKNLAQATAATAEQVMDYDRARNDENGLNTATTMRNDFQELADQIDQDFKLDKSNAAKLLVAVMIQVNQVQDRINNLKKALVGYQTDLIPKLQAIVDASDDATASEIAEQKFILDNNE